MSVYTVSFTLSSWSVPRRELIGGAEDCVYHFAVCCLCIQWLCLVIVRCVIPSNRVMCSWDWLHCSPAYPFDAYFLVLYLHACSIIV